MKFELTSHDMRSLRTWFVTKGCNTENEELEAKLEAVEDAITNLINLLEREGHI